MNVSATLIECTISILSAVITTVLLPIIAQYAMAKINNQKLNSAIEDITQCVATSVDFMEQTMVAQLKSDGKWNSQTQQEVMNNAMNTAIKMMSDSTLQWLKANQKDAQDIVSCYIEAYIHSTKEEIK